jgi:hypothetical protein
VLTPLNLSTTAQGSTRDDVCDEIRCPLRFVVHLDDATFTINDDNRIWNRVDQTAKIPFAPVTPLDFGPKNLVGVREFGRPLGDARFELGTLGGQCLHCASQRIVKGADQSGNGNKCRELNDARCIYCTE